MGRGRAKAKQTKVARELKYSSPGMDLNRLSQDLHTGGFASPPPTAAKRRDDDDEPRWSGEDVEDDVDEDSAAS